MNRALAPAGIGWPQQLSMYADFVMSGGHDDLP
jgi:hypothetical protein